MTDKIPANPNERDQLKASPQPERDALAQALEETQKQRGEDGRFVAGNSQSVLQKGLKNGRSSTLRAKARDIALAELETRIPGLISKLEDIVMEGGSGAVQAASTLLKHAVPVAKSETRFDDEVFDDISHMAPESRIRLINKAVLQGKCSAEAARLVIDAARHEQESEVIGKVRALAKDLRNGIPAEQAVQRLAHITSEIDEGRDG
jgi:hypothetical protein